MRSWARYSSTNSLFPKQKLCHQSRQTQTPTTNKTHTAASSLLSLSTRRPTSSLTPSNKAAVKPTRLWNSHPARQTEQIRRISIQYTSQHRGVTSGFGTITAPTCCFLRFGVLAPTDLDILVHNIVNSHDYYTGVFTSNLSNLMEHTWSQQFASTIKNARRLALDASEITSECAILGVPALSIIFRKVKTLALFLRPDLECLYNS